MPKEVKSSAIRDRQGVAGVQQIVVSRLGWLFREQPTDDFGIDAQIEVVERGAATGRLIAVQIKSGSSYFNEPEPDGWWFRVNADDLDYWLDHSLPVAVVLYDPSSETAYWEVVTPKSVVTGARGGKKILVKQAQQLGPDSKKELAKVSEGTPYELRLRELRLALPWMELLSSGRRILVEVDEWVNKTSGRGDIRIVSVNDANEDRKELGSWFIMVGLRPYEEVLPSLVPWADMVLHEETYDEADYDAWEAASVYYDREGDRIVTDDYDDWKAAERVGSGGLRPYDNVAGEVDRWRLELQLNELGRGFLAVDRYANGEGWILTPQ